MKWNHWNRCSIDENEVLHLAKETNCSLLVASTLWARGLRDKKTIAIFLQNDITALHDPLTMAGMQDGARRVAAAISQNETVAVYGDYDVDGITASVLMVDFLRSKGLGCKVYIPDRLGEGYGLTIDALQRLQKEGVTLIITVDCGITAVEEVAYAKTLGIDMIITDHHQCQDVLPAAVAVINPHRPDCSYPNKELAGVGVAFQFIAAIEGPDRLAALLTRYSDLVAAGTVADVMPLSGENRALVSFGLQSIRRSERVGFDRLMHEASIDPNFATATDISYFLAPRLNAAGRMGDAMLAFSLLETESFADAAKQAAMLCELNQKRQDVEAAILEESITRLAEENYTDGPIILASETWHKGVLGVVASKLMDRFHAPILMLHIENGIARGSCRAMPDFDLFLALQACAHLLDSFGGHAQAAGITVEAQNLEAFKSAFLAYYHANPPSKESRVLACDFAVPSPAFLTLDQVKSLSRLEPCGQANPSPMLILEEATLTKIIPIGKGKHLRLSLEKWGHSFDCIYFSTTAEDLNASEGTVVDIAFTPQCNHFRGKTSVQFLIRDLVKTSTALITAAQRFCSAVLNKTTAPDWIHPPPPRSVFVSLWKLLSATANGFSPAPYEALITQLHKQLGCTSFSDLVICLSVFSELGLLICSEDANGLVHLQLSQSTSKVALEQSSILKALNKKQEVTA